MKSHVAWIIVFLFLFGLASVYWLFDFTSPGYLGVPGWVMYFFLLQVLLGALVFIFTQEHWEDKQ